jgi:glutathione S-transferase
MTAALTPDQFAKALARLAVAEEIFPLRQCLTCLTVKRRQAGDERLGGRRGDFARWSKSANMKIIIGNKNYSSWSLRGWLAVKQSGLHFDELTVPIMGEEWEQLKQEMGEVQPSSGKVPILWDDEVVIWDSLAILEYLGDKVGRDRFWPKDAAARGMARSMVAEMHSGYQSLRRQLPMNIRRRMELQGVSDDTRRDIVRILQLWAEARARYGNAGPYLFGTFGAADIFYAPVVTRFVTYGIGVPGFAQSYMEAVLEHAWMREWTHAAEDEQWVIEQFEQVG